MNTTFEVESVYVSSRPTKTENHSDMAVLILPNGHKIWVNLQRQESPYSFEFEGKTYYITEESYNDHKDDL